MPESLRMRPFRNKGDVKRMMQRLFGSAADDKETFDPVTVAAMLVKADGIPGAFSTVIPWVAGGSPVSWDWWIYPASILFRDSGGADSTRGKGFYNPGQDIMLGTTPVDPYPVAPLNGWYFLPDTLAFSFFTSAKVAKAGRVELVNSFSTFEPFAAEPTFDDSDPRNLHILAKRTTAGDSEIIVFSPGIAGFANALFPFPLFIGGKIIIKAATSLIAGDQYVVRMTGRWFFDPHFIPSSEERNG